MRSLLVIGIVLAIPTTGLAQPSTAMGVSDKLSFHLSQSVGPMGVRRRCGVRRPAPGGRQSDRMGARRIRLRQAPRVDRRLLRDPQCSRFWLGCSPARGSALFPFRRRRLLAAHGTRVPRHGSHAHGPGNRNAVHLAPWQRLWSGLSLESVVSARAEHGGTRIRSGLARTRVRSGQEPGIGVLAGSETEDIAPETMIAPQNCPKG